MTGTSMLPRTPLCAADLTWYATRLERANARLDDHVLASTGWLLRSMLTDAAVRAGDEATLHRLAVLALAELRTYVVPGTGGPALSAGELSALADEITEVSERHSTEALARLASAIWARVHESARRHAQVRILHRLAWATLAELSVYPPALLMAGVVTV
ncbi:hypothetical protein GCM10010156_76540 [Planobispora rosea]|uniref:Uncharacterized protein n=1 Tax=Planobispora rosea TaxID=35762 RepID=A0A8J3WHX4_PLARO|nr:hypothetical protein [Planobispora rosea]GGT08153.1 hypothetical protein GCM10010156_76540 [Planobispora rosea]GIH89132.1 hypothetical protein Pro02_75400 [Planobispora rosea]